MNQLRNFFVLTLLALAPWASGQQLLKPEAFEPESHILKVEFSDPQELAAQGWQQVHAEEWRRTTEDGTETILTFGLTAIEASLTYLDERLPQWVPTQMGTQMGTSLLGEKNYPNGYQPPWREKLPPNGYPPNGYQPLWREKQKNAQK